MSSILQNLVSRLYQLVKGRPLGTSAAYSPEKLAIISRQIAENISVLALLAVLVALVWKYQKRWVSKAILAATLVDLFLFSKGNVITIPYSAVSVQNPVAEWLKMQEGKERFFSTSGNLPYTGLGVYWTNLRAREPFSPNGLTDEELTEFSRLKKELKAFPENQGMMARLFDVSGYAAAIPKGNLAFWSTEPSSPNAPEITDVPGEKLNIVGTKYVVTGYPDDHINSLGEEKFSLIRQINGMNVYENNFAWPRAFLLEETKRIPAEITSYEPTKVVVEADGKEEGFFVLTDTYYPGWIARVDGKKVPIQRYHGAFRQLLVPAGKHTVEFLYRPTSIRLGAIISLLTLSGSGIFVWLEKRKFQ